MWEIAPAFYLLLKLINYFCYFIYYYLLLKLIYYFTSVALDFIILS